MKVRSDSRFEDERVRFGLRLHCEDCALWDEERDACAHGFPTAEHRRPDAEPRDVLIVFCKDFEVA